MLMCGIMSICLRFCYFPQLHKLKGRRNRHEEINIVDVNAADQIGDSAGMMAKYGTEEIAYAPSRVNGNFRIRLDPWRCMH